jgi:uncharacterized protein YciI
MRLWILLLSSIVLCIPGRSKAQNAHYDAALADSLGADDYGMKNYTLVLLSNGPNDTMDQSFISNCFRSHFENMQDMAESGLLILAGPMGKNEQDLRGIFIIDHTDPLKVKELLEGDQAIASGILEATILPWYGSAGLPAYLNTHERIWKLKP